MTSKADFTEEEWETVAKGPPSAGMAVAAAQRGGSFRESFSMAKSYTEARKAHGASTMLDELVSAKPKLDHTHHRSVEELQKASMQNVRDALEVLETKASAEEVDEYKRFVLGLAQSVAAAHREGFMGMSGERVSDTERAAVGMVAETLGLDPPA